MDQATLFDHCIVYTRGTLCNNPSPKFNGLCVDHQDCIMVCTSSAWEFHYCDVFKPNFTAEIKEMLDNIHDAEKSKDNASRINATFELLSKHKHFLNEFIKLMATTKDKIIELSQKRVTSFTQTENDALVQDMKIHYRNMFPYDCHEFNL